MNRIGILTFHDADNFGAVLQSYALQKAFDKLGGYSEIVDYKCQEISKTKVKKNEGIKGLFYNIYYAYKGIGFNKFRKKYLILSQEEYDLNSLKLSNEKYDIFVTGSDQIWNLSCSGNDYSYFLDFAEDNKRKYSYAASIGTYQFSNIEQDKLKVLLDRFDAISVRESSAVNSLSHIDNRYDIIQNVDPVLLLRKEMWQRIMARRVVNKKYIFIYLIQEDVNVIKCAKEYAKANGYYVINNKNSLEFFTHNAPSYFLSFIYYSEAVFTNSFHGTAFSVLFNKKLAADVELANGGINNRINELLTLLGARKCIIDRSTQAPEKPDCEKELDILIRESWDYLARIIQ